jgi:hypothetical protein
MCEAGAHSSSWGIFSGWDMLGSLQKGLGGCRQGLLWAWMSFVGVLLWASMIGVCKASDGDHQYLYCCVFCVLQVNACSLSSSCWFWVVPHMLSSVCC